MSWLLKLSWWKYLTIAILYYILLAGFLMPVPRLAILNETIRVLHFHVPMWFGMIILMLMSAIYAIRVLSNTDIENSTHSNFSDRFDDYSVELANVGLFLGLLGLVTGMIWAQFTWGSYWSSDPKQNASAIGMLIYLAYFVLRGSIEDVDQKRRISAIYNVFAFPILIALLFILPRLTDSLHPGNGGNPGFNSYDLDSNLRIVFYPAVIGWTLLGLWVSTVRVRKRVILRLYHEVNVNSGMD